MRAGCAAVSALPRRPSGSQGRSPGHRRTDPPRLGHPHPPRRDPTGPRRPRPRPASRPRRSRRGRGRPLHPLCHHHRDRRCRAVRCGRRRGTTRGPVPAAAAPPARSASGRVRRCPRPGCRSRRPAHPRTAAMTLTSIARGTMGWGVAGGGRAANVAAGTRYAGTTSQLCGLFPFAVASGAELTGVPVGRSLHTAEPVGLDPAHWLRTGLISNTGVWVQGQPGIGKSSITKRLVVGLVGFGMRALIPGDIKGEYTPLITALGGTVWRLGRGHHTLNPLDPGLAAPALAAAVGTQRHQIGENLRTRTLALLEALLAITSGRALSATGRRLLATALDQTTASRIEPTIPDLLHALTICAEPLPQIVAADAERDYARAVRGLVNTLGLLCDGSLRGLFDRPSTITADPTTPAMSLDLSALDNDADDVVAAAMLCSWAWSATLADTAGDHRNTVQVQDELWRALRAAPGLVEHSDRITRLGRHRGIISIQVTHSLADLDALPTPTDRAKARGMAARNAILILGGMAPQDLDRLSGIAALTNPERELVASWAAPPTWHPGHIHPGRGRYLIMSGQRIGLPVGLRLTPTEARLYDTDTAFRTQP